MRASQSGLTGAEGQAAVEQQFTRIRWGVARNPMEHDLGTDLWLQSRDPRRFDMGALVGAQVKSGDSWFRSPERDDAGKVIGWWFADSDGAHLKHWKDHNVPHILVLHDLKTSTSYWVPITSDRIVSTGKGSKILVPASNTVDEDHLNDLLEVATGHRKPAQWEGSAFEGGEPILRPDRLRHALLTPRLIAPHPNLAVDSYQPDEAIALLVKMRLRELRPSKSPYWETKAPDLEGCRASKDWEWRFYAALYSFLVEGGDLGAIRELIDADDALPHQQAAAAVVVAALLVEMNRPSDALEVLDRLIEADVCEPTDHAWLMLHRARCRAELGDLEQALESAVEVQSLRTIAPHDPTAMAIVGAAADLIFGISSQASRNVADAVTGRDTLAAWWRTQEVAWALQEKAREDFKNWAEDKTIRWGKSDQTWLHLRAATLISGFTADHTAWRAATSMLAQRVITTATENTDAVVSALTQMLHCGDNEAIKLSLGRLLRAGPVQAVQQAASAIILDDATRTSLLASITAITKAADVLLPEHAVRHAQWAIEVLNDPAVLADRLAPTFSIPDIVLDMLAALVPVLSTSDLRVVVDHLVTLPAQEDQAIAHGYAKVVRAVPVAEWSDADKERLAQRTSDNFELSEQIEVVLAASDETRRRGLEEQIAQGDLAALQAFGDVCDLNADTVTALVESLNQSIETEVAELQRGQGAVRRTSFGGTLIVVNCWHPEQASWDRIVNLLSQSATYTRHLVRPLENLRRLGDAVPSDVSDRLAPILRQIMARTTQPADAFFGNPDVRGDAAAALEAMQPSSITETELWNLMNGTTNQRVGAALIVASRRRPENLNVLAAIARDPDPWVRAVVANQVADWICDGVATDSASALLERILAEDRGTVVARMVAVRLDGAARTTATDQIAAQLEDHPSAEVRSEVAAHRSKPMVPTAQPNKQGHVS